MTYSNGIVYETVNLFDLMLDLGRDLADFFFFFWIKPSGFRIKHYSKQTILVTSFHEFQFIFNETI